MSTVWVSAVKIDDDGAFVDFTVKGEAAIQGLFEKLDTDGSGGLSYEEFKHFLLVTENIDLDAAQFGDLGLATTSSGEISILGFKDLYRVIYEGDGPEKGSDRFRKDLEKFGVDGLLKGKDAASLLMSRTKELPNLAKGKRRPSSPENVLKHVDATEHLPLIDLTSTQSQSHNTEQIILIDETSLDASRHAEVAQNPITTKPLHPFFGNKPVKNAQRAITPPPVIEASDIVACDGKEPKQIHPFFLKRARGASVNNRDELVEDYLAYENSMPSRSSIFEILRGLTKTVEFPPVPNDIPKLHHQPDAPVSRSPAIPNSQEVSNLIADNLTFSKMLSASVDKNSEDLIDHTPTKPVKRHRASPDVVPLESPVNLVEQYTGDIAIDLINVIDKQVAWPTKYAPKLGNQVVDNAGAIEKLRDWLRPFLEEKSRTDSEESSLSDDEDKDWGHDGDVVDAKCALVTGPWGSGKTSAVYAMADELGFRPLEVNSTDDLSRIKTLVGEASQSYGLAKTGRGLEFPLILVDEFDSGFGDDPAAYLTSLRHVIRTTKAPMILICDEALPKVISTNGYDLEGKILPVELIRFERPSPVLVAPRLRAILENEGRYLTPDNALAIAKHFRGDIRKCLHHIQFWGPLAISQITESQKNEEPIALVDDGFDGLLTMGLGRTPLVSSVKPVPLDDISQQFSVEGTYFGDKVSATRVWVGGSACSHVTLESESLLYAILAPASVSEKDEEEAFEVIQKTGANESDAISSEDPVESELEDEPIKCKPTRGRSLKTIRQYQILPSVVVETSVGLRIRCPLREDKVLTISHRSDDRMDQRFNSMFSVPDVTKIAELETTIPPVTSYPEFIKNVNLEHAKANLASLHALSAHCDSMALADSVLKPDVTGENFDECYSRCEDLGESISLALGMSLSARARGAAIDLAALGYNSQLRRHWIRIDEQRPKAYWEDIPMFIRMSRLDEISLRSQNSRRRRAVSHFTKNAMQWLNTAEVARLGLQDLDLGWKAYDDDETEETFVEL